jgi:SEC-C motif-containing protein
MKCYCGLEKEFKQCCELYLTEKETPARAELLMRSRYSAYCTKQLDYLVQTTDPQARFEIDAQANADWAEQAQFQKLEIIKTEESGTKSLVEFKATYFYANETHVHHEVSTFRKTNGVWYFRSGRIIKA